jgi:hypothetical protein
VARVGFIGLLLAATSGALTVPAAEARSARVAAAETITAQWSGHVDWTEVYDPSRPAIELNTGSIGWTYSITVRATPSGGMVVGRPQLTINGKLTETAAPPNQGLDCTGTLSARPGAPANQFGPVGIVYQGPSWGLDAFPPWTGEWAASTGRPNSGCATVPNGGSPAPACGSRPEPQLGLLPRELPWSHEPYPLSGVGRNNNGAVDCWMSGTATLAFTGTGAGTPATVPATPGRFRAKALATMALETTYQDALYPCLATAATVPLFGLGPIGQVVGLGVGAIGGPLCLAYLKTIDELAQVIKDPPLDSFDQIARPLVARTAVTLPACSRFSGAAATLCTQLEPRLLRLLGAAQRVQSVTGAMRTTIARESGALKARNAGAVRRQDRALVGLDRQLVAALSARTAAGTSLGALLNAAAIPVTLPGAQAASAGQSVAKRLAALGLSRRTLASVLGGVGAAAPYDWTAALGG